MLVRPRPDPWKIPGKSVLKVQRGNGWLQNVTAGGGGGGVSLIKISHKNGEYVSRSKMSLEESRNAAGGRRIEAKEKASQY